MCYLIFKVFIYIWGRELFDFQVFIDIKAEPFEEMHCLFLVTLYKAVQGLIQSIAQWAASFFMMISTVLKISYWILACMVNIQGAEEQYLEITLRYFSYVFLFQSRAQFFTEVFVSFLQRVLTQCCSKIEIKQTCNSIVFKSRILEKKIWREKNWLQIKWSFNLRNTFQFWEATIFHCFFWANENEIWKTKTWAFFKTSLIRLHGNRFLKFIFIWDIFMVLPTHILQIAWVNQWLNSEWMPRHKKIASFNEM